MTANKSIDPADRALVDELTIRPPGAACLEALSTRLTFKSEKRAFLRPKAGIAPPFPAAEKEFVAACLETVELPARVYSVTGHDTVIVVCEDYARKQDATRSLRLERQAKASSTQHPRPVRHLRAIPEDIVALLDELPDARYFSEVQLLGWENPRDPWLRQLYGNQCFTSAAGTGSDGRVEFYRGRNNQFLRVNLSHEWAHRLEHRNPDIFRAFHDALEMEWRIFVPNTYALRSYAEHGAVIGEELLHTDGSRFLATALKAPIRTAVWMQALELALATVPDDRHGRLHRQFTTRCQWARENIRPLADAALSLAIERAQRVQEALQERAE